MNNLRPDVKTRYALMRRGDIEAIYTSETVADLVAEYLNDGHDNLPYYVLPVTPGEEVIAANARVTRSWRSTRTGLTLNYVTGMSIDHLTNAAHLCLTWQDRFGTPMDSERRAMCQNVRDEIVRRKINEVGK